MANKIEDFNKAQLKQVPKISSGDTVKIHQIIKEGDKERVQVFEGMVLSTKHGTGISATIKVRRVISGIGVEKTFPLHSPLIGKIEVIRKGRTKRSKLYYLRTAKGKKAKIKEDIAV